MEIRRATAADSAVLGRFWESSSAEIDFTPYPGAAFDESLLAEHVALVAEDGGEPIGAVYANLSGEHFGYVFGLYVRPEARRRGVGRALMRSIAAVLRDEGREYVLLSVDIPNTTALQLYERLGFTDAARMLRIRTDDLLGGDDS